MTDGFPRQRPVLLEVHGQDWAALQDRVTPWLATTITLQRTFRRLSVRVSRTVSEPHIRSYLRDVARTAHRHEAVALDLYRAFGLQQPVRLPSAVASTLLSAGRYASGQLVGMAAGARSSPWRGMRVLMRSNLDAISCFAVTEQLGLALGAPPVVDLTFPVLAEKQSQQLLIQEYLLELASTAILDPRDA